MSGRGERRGDADDAVMLGACTRRRQRGPNDQTFALAHRATRPYDPPAPPTPWWAARFPPPRSRMQLRALLAAALVAAPLVALPARGVAQGPTNQLLVVDTRLNRVVTVSAVDGSIVNASFITDANSAATYDFVTPRAAIRVANQIWVSDQSPTINAIYRFDLNGTYLGRVGGADGGLSNVRGLRYIDGVVYAVNAGTTNGAPGPAIVRVATDGTILGSFATTANGVGVQPWDVMQVGNELFVTDGTSRSVLRFNSLGEYLGAFTGAFNNIPQQMALTASGTLLVAANGSQPLNSFGLYEFSAAGTLLRSWAGTPGLGVRGVAQLANGRYLISEAGGNSATRGLGTIDPNGVADNSNFTLIQGNWNGGWISPFDLPQTTVPEPSAALLLLPGLAGVVALRRRAARRDG